MIKPLPEPDFLQHRLRGSVGFRLGCPPDIERHRHVFERREFRKQVMELIDKAETPVSQVTARLLIHPSDIDTIHHHAPGVGVIQPADTVKERRLAGA